MNLMKKLLLIFCILFIYSSIAVADHIIPTGDPVYPFFETAQNLGYSERLTSVYPQYHEEIINNLIHMLSLDIAESYKKLAGYHLRRLLLDSSDGFKSALYPIKIIPQSFLSIFTNHYQKNRLFLFKKGDTNLFLSGIIGFNYDLLKTENNYEYRFLKYYGLEIAGNLLKNFGFYSQFQKGHYKGDLIFIEEDYYTYTESFETWEENPERVITSAEIDFKNKFINLSLGYGAIGLGHSNTSSIILNSSPSSYGYFKFYKNFNSINYLIMNGQLFPDSVSVFSDYSQKSIALQVIYFNSESILIGLGQTVIYGDKNIDLGYITPVIWFKLIDFKYRQRDNVQMFVFGNFLPMKGLLLYSNIFIDDLKKSRLFTEYWLTNFALQGGLEYSFMNFPLKLFSEVTAIGPNTYAHKTNKLCYTNDSQYLGYKYGSNILTFSTGIQYLNSKYNIYLKYLNMQQGSMGSNPFRYNEYNYRFLEGELSRRQIISAEAQFFLSSHLNLHLKYEYENKDDITKNYFYSGIELKY